tara:strand:+ start:69819 stop:71780 length:1962 start_codon:yes stop_codon:yes gene_type:complete
MGNSNIVRWLVIAAALTASACENANSIFRTINFNDGQSYVTDAKQRVIINTAIYDEDEFYGRVKPKRIVCAEPSPDVAQAFSAALSLAVSVASKGDGSLGYSSASAVGQLVERIATIQLLRDELADLCRSYANGAVTNTTYTLRLSRLDKKMVTLLMGEMSAGAFGRNLAVIQASGASTTATKGSPEDIKNARDSLDAAVAAKKAEDEKLNNVPDGDEAALKQHRESVDAAALVVAARSEDLRTLLAKSASTFTSAGGDGQPGTISGRINDTLALASGNIVRLQSNYLAEDDLGTLLAACIGATDLKEKGGRKGSPIQNVIDENKSLATHREELELKATDLKKIADLIIEKNAQLAETKTRINEITGQLTKFLTGKIVSQNFTDTISALSLLSRDIGDKGDALKGAREQIEKTQAKIGELTKSISNNSDRLSKASTDWEKSVLEREIATSTGQLGQLSTQLETSLQTIKAQESQFMNTRKKLENQETGLQAYQINPLQGTGLERADTEIAALRQKAESLEKEVDNLEKEKNATESNIVQITAEIKKSEESVSRALEIQKQTALSPFGQYCERSLPEIRLMIREQYSQESRLRELALNSELNISNVSFCRTVLDKGDTAPAEAKDYCKRLLTNAPAPRLAGTPSVMQEQLPKLE